MTKENSDIKFSKEEIYKQVDKVCQSSELKTKSLLCKLLRYVVDETIAGRGDNIKGYTIGVDIFNKENNFDPGQDPLVRIHAGRLRRALRLYYLETGKNDSIRIDIPKGNYVPAFLPNDETTGAENNFQTKNIQLDTEPSVAVIPFKNLTGDDEFNYFSSGITEELSIELTKYEDLSVYNFSHFENNDNPESGFKEHIKSRGVRYIIGGSVNKIGKQVKILAQLTDITEDRQIWAESFIKELTLENLFEIQETLSQEIAIKIGSEYGAILQKLAFDSGLSEFQNFDIYDAVLKFYYFQVHLTPESGEAAFKALNDAVTKDPESGIALALLAAMYGNSYFLDLPDAKTSFEMLGTLSENAGRLAPNSLMVKTVLAVKCFAYNDKERFLHLVEECLSISQNSSLRTGVSAFYISLYGDWERGKKLLDKLMCQNIGYPLYFHGATMLYYYRKNEYEMALKEANKYTVPTLFWAPLLRVAATGQLNLKTEAQKNIDHLLKYKPDFELKAAYLISRYVKEDELVNHILEGLRKAGMKV